MGRFVRMLTLQTLLLLIFACTSRVALAEDWLERAERLNDFAGSGWAFDIGSSLAEVERLEKLLRQDVTETRNRHVKGQVDEARVLHFDGLVVRMYFPAKDHGHLQITGVTISKRRWPVKQGLGVGAPWDAVKEKLGEPNEKQATSAKYCGESDCVIFSLLNGRVSRITWDLYHD